MSTLYRYLSWLWPIRVASRSGRYMELHLEWQNGRLVVDSARANQSQGSLLRVWLVVLRDQLKDRPPPASVLLLGFGAGSAAQVLRREMAFGCPLVGVDGDPAMLSIARDHFGWAPGPDLELHCADAAVHLASEQRSFDLLLVDLFIEDRHSDLLDSKDFLSSLKQRLTPGGLVLVNTVDHGPGYPERSARLAGDLRLLFGHVGSLELEGVNRVFIAR